MTRAFQTESDILDIVHGFREVTLPKERWTHEAHLITAIWFHVNHSELEAICFLRSGIIAYNNATGGKNTPTDGYHETITLFWCKTIYAFVSARRDLSLIEICRAFLNSEQSAKEYPFRFYSREVLLSLKARAVWVDPDL